MCAGISRHLDGDIETAEQHILRANSIIRSDKMEASSLLMKLGESLLAIDQPGLALEVLDEAMGVAENESKNQLESLADHILMANAAMTNDDVIQHEGLRTLLDGLNQLSEQESVEFAKKIRELSNWQR